MNFNYSENIYLRKNCEIHDIYPLANNDLILLIYFNNSFYLDRIKLLISRDLIKLDVKPIFAFICGPTNLGLIYRTEEKQKLLVFDSKTSILKNQKLNFKHDQEFFSLYFKETQITLLFGKSLDSISCFWLNKKQEIFNSFKLKENMDQIQKLLFFQLNNHNTFLYSVIKQQDTLIAVESNGQQKNIKTQQSCILNGCAQQNNIIILFYTPENEQSSIIELINEKNEQIKVIDLNQNQFQFLVSIEYVLFQNDQYIWCRVSTDQMKNYQQIWVLDKEEFKLQHTKIYEDEILQCICQKDLQIDQGIGLYERQKLLYLEENEEQEMYDEEAFDDFSEILVSFNLNPFYQLIKIMNQQNYDENIIIDVCNKLENTQIQF